MDFSSAAEGSRADDLGDVFERLSVELEDAVRGQVEIDLERLANKYQIDKDKVKICLEAIEALAGVVAVATAKKPEKLGDYEIKEELGRGGMGVVYRAYHPTLERDVAVKVSKFGDTPNQDLIERFLIEGRLVAKLRHPNIITIHDVGMEDGTHYQVMDLINGESLHDLLKREGAQSLEKGAAIALKLAQALDHAHNRSIVHRDVKPRNIILNRAGEPVLMDFGLAKDVAAKSKTLTRTGQFIGTLRYASPEQMRGEKHDIDQRTDLYNLGATLYHMLCGHAPFADLPETKTVDAILNKTADFNSFLDNSKAQSGAILTVCRRCLKKQPGDRYQSARELITDLERVLAGELVCVTVDAPEPRQRPVQSLKIFVMGLVMGLIIGIFLATWVF
jgi:eukaryotic-like serine/threonine-protein kinase